MAGGGRSDPFFGKADLDRLREGATKKAADSDLTTQVNSYLKEQLATITDRDVDSTRRRLEEIKDALGADIEGMEEILFGGSVAKHTYVDGLSDVDALVLIDSGTLEEKNPRQLLKHFTDSLKVRLSRQEIVSIESGTLAVTVKYSDGSELQLLPAYRSGKGFAIGNKSGDNWTQIHPRRFARQLAKTNRELGGLLIPVIKLAKSIIADFPEQRRLSGYHIEALAERSLHGFTGPRTLKDLLTHLFVSASELVRSPFVDPTGQSKHIDGDLGSKNSNERRMVADSLARVARRMQTVGSLAQWKLLLSDLNPGNPDE